MVVAIDKRPLWVILLSKSYRPLIFLAIALAFWGILNLPTPEGLTQEGHKAIAVFFICVALWVTSLIPLSITSLLAIILIPFLGIMESKKAYAFFGNEAVFFILGAFILAAAIMKSGLSTRLALAVLGRFGKTPKRLLSAVYLFPAFLSFWMSEHAVAAMMFPIVVEIAKVLELRPLRSEYGKALFIAMAWGCIIGGVATFLGGARNPLAVGILLETTGQSIGFFEWMLAVVPAVIVMLAVGYLMLFRFFKIDLKDVRQVEEALVNKRIEMGLMTWEERLIGFIMLLTIMTWMLLGKKLGLANIALASVVALFFMDLIKWKDVEGYVNWGVILMYGGAITLGYTLDKSGAAAWSANSTIMMLVSSPLVAIAIFSFLSIALTEFISNAAVIAILMPVALSIAKQLGIDPKIMTFAIAVPSGLAFMLPIGTPANAIAYSSGFIRMRDMVIPGLIMGITAWLVFIMVGYLYWPMLGLKI
jgi:sodium-dependent dicarboxylate transporter 2/3/5